jgi:hypothetical protein
LTFAVEFLSRCLSYGFIPFVKIGAATLFARPSKPDDYPERESACLDNNCL